VCINASRTSSNTVRFAPSHHRTIAHRMLTISRSAKSQRFREEIRASAMPGSSFEWPSYLTFELQRQGKQSRIDAMHWMMANSPNMTTLMEMGTSIAGLAVGWRDAILFLKRIGLLEITEVDDGWHRLQARSNDSNT
jgi:hypothetical protein